jgi:hypothetical protein
MGKQLLTAGKTATALGSSKSPGEFWNPALLPEPDGLTLICDRTRRRFKNLDHPQAGHSAGNRLRTGAYALDEVLDLGLQCLPCGDVRCPHVAGTIPDSEFMGIFGP